MKIHENPAVIALTELHKAAVQNFLHAAKRLQDDLKATVENAECLARGEASYRLDYRLNSAAMVDLIRYATQVDAFRNAIPHVHTATN